MAGSSGRLDVGRANLLASRGTTALALRWFGGEAQPVVPCEIPLDTFTEAIDMLAVECERIVLMGLSYGAEAALLTASVDGRVDAVVALALGCGTFSGPLISECVQLAIRVSYQACSTSFGVQYPRAEWSRF